MDVLETETEWYLPPEHETHVKWWQPFAPWCCGRQTTPFTTNWSVCRRCRSLKAYGHIAAHTVNEFFADSLVGWPRMTVEEYRDYVDCQ